MTAIDLTEAQPLRRLLTGWNADTTPVTARTLPAILDRWAAEADLGRYLREHKPDRLLILGDTNSGLIALVAR